MQKILCALALILVALFVIGCPLMLDLRPPSAQSIGATIGMASSLTGLFILLRRFPATAVAIFSGPEPFFILAATALAGGWLGFIVFTKLL